MTGFEPATSRPPAVYANQTAPHPECNDETKKKTAVSCNFFKLAQLHSLSSK